jgi:hypothetical protein
VNLSRRGKRNYPRNVELLRTEANQYAVSIRTELVADLPKISADRVQLRQVFMNLILNAIEAMKETGGGPYCQDDCPRKKRSRFLTRALPPSDKAAACDYLSIVPLSSRTEAVCG